MIRRLAACILAAVLALTLLPGAALAGASCAIEKGFQRGGDALRERGIRVESLAVIDSMTDDSVTFRA